MTQEGVSVLKLHLGLLKAMVSVIVVCLGHLGNLPELYVEFGTDLDVIHKAVDTLISHVEVHLGGG
jgi:hypothetical protein